MSEPEAEPVEVEAEPVSPRRSRLRRALVVLLLLLGFAVLGVWIARERIANSIIAGQLSDLGIPATYEIESIGTRRQVLKNVVVGDPRRPDFTAARAIVVFEPRFGIPVLGSVTLEQARLYGTYTGGKLSFGRLDPVIFKKSEGGPAGLPDLDLTLIDGRARIDGDLGVIGAKIEGRGNLRNSFNGIVAAVSPELAVADCRSGKASLYSKVSTAAGKVSFDGPLRLERLSCPSRQLALGTTALQLTGELTDDFKGGKADFGIDARQAVWSSGSLAGLLGKGRVSLADGDVVGSYQLDGRGVDLGAAGAGTLAVEGSLRSYDDMARFEGEGSVRGSDVRGGKALVDALAGLEKSGKDNLLGPLAGQIKAALAREERGSRLRADYSVRQTGAITQVTLPSAELTGASGTRLIGVSRFGLALGMNGGPRFSGSFVTGGAGLPRMEGIAQSSGNGTMQARFSLAEYRAGSSSIAIPDIRIVQLPGGQIGFAGRALVSGKVPGGEVRGLAMPVEGNWSQGAGLSVWRKCTLASFQSWTIGSLRLADRALNLCPGKGGAIVRSDAAGLRIAAGTAGVDLAGTLGKTPVRIRSGAIGMAWPGAVAARKLDIVFGPSDKPNTLTVATFDGRLGDVVTGRFGGASARLFAVPLDISEANGQLRFANNILDLSDADLRLTDREQPARFEPLIGRGAKLRLADNLITADTLLREPRSDRQVVIASIVHNLNSGIGYADLDVPGLLFDGVMQPDTLTYFAEGVIALAKGTVTGKGRIDWNPAGVTSTGSFTTEGLDFAAAFGPVKGLKGTVVFTDLLGLVTAPDQRLTLASINPGIEVFDGSLSFKLDPDRLLLVNGAEWPFMDGNLKLLPTRLVLGTAEVRRFTLKVEGANAAKFVSTLDLGNINATGIFDGTLPLVFDEEGGRIENGILVSRPPGGNISYVGELTYKDLSAMGNFAFQTLRSLDFSRMEVGIDGEIDGDIVTNMRIEGVRQGEGARKNFVTRQIGNLPIQFNINIKAPFYQLVTSFKSLYDPAYVRDPRSLGLLDDQGRPVLSPGTPISPDPKTLPPIKPSALPPPAAPATKPADIQQSDSRNSP